MQCLKLGRISFETATGYSKGSFWSKRAFRSVLFLFVIISLSCVSLVSVSCGRRKDSSTAVKSKANAVLLFSRGEVSLKSPDLKTWLIPGFSIPIEDGDILHTGADGEAFLLLRHASRLYLAPRTTVRFYFRADKREFEISRGDLKLWSGTPVTNIKMVTPVGSVNANSSTFSISVVPGKSLSLAVEKGSVQLALNQGESKELTGGEGITVPFATIQPQPLEGEVNSFIGRFNASPFAAVLLLPDFFKDRDVKEEIKSEAISKIDLGIPDEWSYVNLGRVLYDEGLYEDARAYFLKALEIKEGMPQALSGVGMTLAAEEKWKDAIEFFKSSLRIDESSLESLTGIGLSYMGAGKLRDARRFLNKALMISGGDARLYCALATINLLEGKFSAAREDLLKANAIETENCLSAILTAGVVMVEESFRLGLSRIKKARNSGLCDLIVDNSAGVNALKEKVFKPSYFRRLVESEDVREKLWGLKNSSVRDIELKNYQSAADSLKNVLNLSPNFACAYADLSFLYCKQGRFEEAISSLKAAMETEPENHIWRESAALIFLERGNLVQAGEAVEGALQLNPGCWVCRLVKGICFFEKGDRENSLLTIRKALKIGPNHGLNSFEHALKGAAFIRIGSMRQAIGELNRATRLDPDNAIYFRLKGDAFSALGDYGKAASSYRQCLKLDPDDKACRIGLVRLLMNKGKHKEAREELDRGLERNPEDLDYLLELAGCLIESKSYEAACESINEIISSRHLDDAHRVEFFILQGLAFKGLGEEERSIEAYRTALAIDSTRGDAWFYMGDSLEALGRTSEAIEAYRKTVECSISLQKWDNLKEKALERITRLER